MDPRENDDISNRQLESDMKKTFGIPVGLVIAGLIAAGGMTWQVRSLSEEIHKKANKEEMTQLEKSLDKDIQHLKEGQYRLEKKVDQNFKEILEILKSENSR